MSAANGRIHAPNVGVSGFPVGESLFELIDESLTAEDRTPETLTGPTDFVPLSRAISVLWHHYQGDERQRTIWSRVVAFHAMMVKTRGSVVQRWTVVYDNAPGVTSLHAAVVNAVAEAPLAEFGEFDPPTFFLCAERFENEFALSSAVSAGATLRTCPPATHPGVVLGRLRAPLSVLTGSVALKLLISRAMWANCDSYPWLKGADLTSESLVIPFPSTGSSPSVDELAKGEAAVTSSLLTSLRTLVGEGVAANLLAAVFDGEAALPR